MNISEQFAIFTVTKTPTNSKSSTKIGIRKCPKEIPCNF